MKNRAKTKTKVGLLHSAMICGSSRSLIRYAESASRSTEDLLVPNPNHATLDPDDPSESGEDGDEE